MNSDIGLSGEDARALIRAGNWHRSTAGLAPGWAQANIVILPKREAEDFRTFCVCNPQACPLMEVTEAGHPEARKSAPGSDLRTDIPRYRIYRHGRVDAEVENILDQWREDFVGFLLGCSFTFEDALLRAGIPLRHVDLGRTVPMYRTNRDTQPAGAFRGPLVVSMRPVAADAVDRAAEVTARYPMSHGAPVHTGDPSALGIADLARPDYGDAVPVHPGEVPVFWACGVTSQAAAEAAQPELMITHAPGHMFITDVPSPARD